MKRATIILALVLVAFAWTPTEAQGIADGMAARLKKRVMDIFSEKSSDLSPRAGAGRLDQMYIEALGRGTVQPTSPRASARASRRSW